MFSKAYYSEIKQYFDGQMVLLENRVEELKKKETEMEEEERKPCQASRELLERKIEEITGLLADCTRDEMEAMQFLYSAMPMSDILSYPASLYLAYARHGIFLWKEGPFAGKVPEKIFANYVLHYRAHNEDIADTRKFFYDRIWERTAHKSMYEAAVEINYWCAEKATYQTTFMRTQNPLTMYGTAAGRCGEEAPFAVTALRSIGIPARSVSSPWWAHCDDNHAWVEAWCDGEWHFLGGCEPERKLDKGWFEGPASRAMLITSRWFGKDEPEEQVVGRPDMAAVVNHLYLYAKTVRLVVKVVDEAGNPIPGARVDFSVLNYGRFNPMTSLHTEKEEKSPDYGKVRVDTGYGDFLVCAYADGCYGETHVSLVEKTDGMQDMERIDSSEASNDSGHDGKAVYEYTVVIRKEMQELGQWREVDFHAPKGVVQDERKTEEEAAAEKAGLERAARSRQQRVEAFYQKEVAEHVLMGFTEEDRTAVDEILHQAKGNMGEIVRFLEWDFAGDVAELEKAYGQEHWKVEALQSLKTNDYWDIRAEVLAECSVCASPYAGAFPREVFFQDLFCPCTMHAFPGSGRARLLDLFSQGQKEEIRKNPRCLPEKLNRFLVSMPEQEYGNLVASPLGCMTGGMGSEISRMVLCVQIYRALGIPARVRPIDRTIEFYRDGAFVSMAAKEAEGKGTLVLEESESIKLEDWKHYSLSRFENGRFMPMFIRPERKNPGTGQESAKTASEKAKRRLELESGIYRIVTTNRLPNGGQLAKVQDLRLDEGEEKRIVLSLREISQKALLSKMPVEDFALHNLEGEEVMLSSLGQGKRALVLWLELTREPTEHILNEMHEKYELFQKITAPIYFVLRKGEDYTGDQTLSKTRSVLPETKLLFDDFGEAYEKLSLQVGQNLGKLPLVMVLEEGKECIFSDCGYNVGMADMLLRILS